MRYVRIKFDKNKFWKWLLLFAYSRIAFDLNFLSVGIPGVRDSNNVCKSYMPGKRDKSPGFNRCDGDGHYLCKKCRFLSKTK